MVILKNQSRSFLLKGSITTALFSNIYNVWQYIFVLAASFLKPQVLQFISNRVWNIQTYNTRGSAFEIRRVSGSIPLKLLRTRNFYRLRVRVTHQMKRLATIHWSSCLPPKKISIKIDVYNSIRVSPKSQKSWTFVRILRISKSRVRRGILEN